MNSQRPYTPMLRDCRPEAEVRIMSQEGWPFENGIHGVCVREDLGGDESCECDHRITEPHEEGCPAVDGYEDGLTADDVFIVEGQAERYGSQDGVERRLCR